MSVVGSVLMVLLRSRDDLLDVALGDKGSEVAAVVEVRVVVAAAVVVVEEEDEELEDEELEADADEPTAPMSSCCLVRALVRNGVLCSDKFGFEEEATAVVTVLVVVVGVAVVMPDDDEDEDADDEEVAPFVPPHDWLSVVLDMDEFCTFNSISFFSLDNNKKRS